MNQFLEEQRTRAARLRLAADVLCRNPVFPPPRQTAQAESPLAVWRFKGSDLETINPNARVTDEEFEVILPDLRVLSEPRASALLRWLLSWNRLPFTQVESMREWRGQARNCVLVVLAAACRVGLFKVDTGEWRQTAFGSGFAAAWKSRTWESSTPLRLFERNWTPALKVELKAAVRWGWTALREERECREIFDRLAACPTGLTHKEFTHDGAGGRAKWQTVRALAAAAAVGAAWFTGWRWEPTMFGAYLAFHPESPLTTPSARASEV